MFTILLATASLAAPPAPPRDPEAVKARIESALEEISASDAQRQSVREILSEQLPYLAQLREEAHALREQMRGLFLAEEIDREAVMAMRLQMVDLFDRATESGLETMLDLAEIFTPEQRATLAEMRQQRMREALQQRASLPSR